MLRLFNVTLFVLFVLSFLTATTGMTAAQMPQAQNETGSQRTKKFLVELADLRLFAIAVKGDLSWCKNNKRCVSRMISIKSWNCIADACAKTGSKDPTSCIYDFHRDKDQGNPLLCNVISVPGPETRQAFLKACPEAQEEGLVEGAAYFLALKGNPNACQDQIKKYKGPYGDQWGIRWYSDLSGCRILAGQRTYKQEEKDFSLWFESRGNVKRCLAIDNTEIRAACEASKGVVPELYPGKIGP